MNVSSISMQYFFNCLLCLGIWWLPACSLNVLIHPGPLSDKDFSVILHVSELTKNIVTYRHMTRNEILTCSEQNFELPVCLLCDKKEDLIIKNNWISKLGFLFTFFCTMRGAIILVKVMKYKYVMHARYKQWLVPDCKYIHFCM